MSRAKRRIMKGDRVKVIRGNYRDMEGAVLEVLQDENRVRVEGVNTRKRHTRPSQKDPDGGIISMVAPIHISNVMLIDASGEKASRVRTRAEKEGTKERVAVKTGNPIPKPK